MSDDLVKRLRGICISAVRANYAVLGASPLITSNETVQAAADRIEALLEVAGQPQVSRNFSPETTSERQLADDILAELVRARTKFPRKNVTFAALIEEVGELATATFEESADRVRKEAVQVAVMAMRMVLDGDHYFDEWRAEKGLDHLDPAERAAQAEGGAG